MAYFIDACRFTPTAGGTADWTYSSAVVGYQGLVAAGAVNGLPYRYRAESGDLTQWEIGVGSYNSSTGVLSRSTVLYNSSGTGTATGQSGAGTKIGFVTLPQVAVVALAEDLANLGTPNTFTDTTEATGAGTTASGIFSGGVEILKKLFVTGAATFKNAVLSTVSVTTAAQFDTSGSPTITCAQGANVAICPAGFLAYGFLVVGENTTGFGALVFVNAGSCAFVFGSGGWTTTGGTGTTTPASGKMSIAYNASTNIYTLYNNTGASITVCATLIRTK
jgi:hypothetical protein